MDDTDKINIACTIFESIKQNWLKSGDFDSLVKITCANLGIVENKDIEDRLKKSNALWLNNKLDDPLDFDPEAEIVDEPPKKKKKTHDHH